MNLAPERPGQPRMMTVTDGIEAGHWYSPEAVLDMLKAERERCAALADDAANKAWTDCFSESWSDEFELLARNIRALGKP